MTDRIDRKVLGYGVGGFVVGQLMTSLAVANTGQSSNGTALGDAAWLFVNFSGYLIPPVIGFLAAYYAPRAKIMHGSLAALMGSLIFVLVAPSVAILVVAGIYSLLGWLGAIAGDFVGRRGGA